MFDIPLVTGTGPDQKAVLLSGTHGLSNDDRETLCAFGQKWNSTVSPTGTVKDSGSKVRPFCPTLTM